MDPLKLFPYKPREGQKALINFIQSVVLEGKRVCIHVPIGFGKTVAILAALLPFVKHGGAIIWTSRKRDETDKPIGELRKINERFGTKFSGIPFRDRCDTCLLARDEGLKDVDREEISFFCKQRVERGECEYGSNIDSLRPNDFLKPMLHSEILQKCEREKICPHMIQQELLPFVHVASMSHGHIISRSLEWMIKRSVPFNRSFLVVDEAHNLQYICFNVNSARITMGMVEGALKEVERFRGEKAAEVSELLLTIQSRLSKMSSELGRGEDKFSTRELLADLTRTGEIESLKEKFDSMQRYGDWIRKSKLEKNERPHSFLSSLGTFWSMVLENSSAEGVVLIASGESENFELEFLDMRASESLKNKWKEFRNCVFCSDVLEPIQAFTETVGLESYVGKNFRLSYDLRRVKTLILKGLSTRGEKLSSNTAKRYIEVLEQFVKVVDMNLAIFSSNHRIQIDLIKAGLAKVVKRNNRHFFQEKLEMGDDEVKRMLDEFKDCAHRKKRGVLCANADGKFGKDFNFLGEELKVIFLVGVPFEHMTIQVRAYLDYYKRLYGGRKGWLYAYVIPALKRASRVLGKVLRSKQDWALLVCGDERYADKRLFDMLPYYVRETSEVVDTEQFINRIETWLRTISD